MNEQANRYLSEEPVGSLMLKFSIPCIMSLLVSALYNIVDQIFIGQGVGMRKLQQQMKPWFFQMEKTQELPTPCLMMGNW